MKIVIIGGVAAGAKAAAKCRRLLPDAQIDIYTQEKYVSYSACGMPYYIEGNFEDWQKLIVRPIEEFEKSGIHVHILNRVTEILPEEKKIVVNNLETNETYSVNYDKLVISTGSTPNLQNFQNLNFKNVYTLKTLEDAVKIRDKMREADNITIVGGGYISIELSEAFVKNGKHVDLMEKSPHILTAFDDDISTIIEKYITENSNGLVELHTEDSVSSFHGDEYVRKVTTSKGLEFETDMVILATGVKPVVDIAQKAGIELGPTGAIKVNSRMRTNFPDIYACGDCAEKIDILSNTPLWVPLGSTANKEGRVAAINLCGGTEDFEGILGSAVTRYLDLNISITGFTEKRAKKFGFDAVSVVITKKDKAGYMPEVENITLKLTAGRRTHRIMGAQGIGCGDADKKVNNISMALVQNMTVEELLDVDFTYAPPFSTSEDILLSAGRLLKAKLSG